MMIVALKLEPLASIMGSSPYKNYTYMLHIVKTGKIWVDIKTMKIGNFSISSYVVAIFWNRLAEAILIDSHNIRFYSNNAKISYYLVYYY